ncbi:MAG: hypothetical protein ACLQSR_14860 [Limisphaerales bacterium]
MESTLSKYTFSCGLALAPASVLNALLVVFKESNHALEVWMQKLTGHQWVTHCAIVIVFFGLCSFAFARANHGHGLRMHSDRLMAIVIGGVVAGYLIINGFYLLGG